MTQTLLGPDGQPLVRGHVEVHDRTITYSKDGEAYTATADELLMAMARAQRDGMSLKGIIAEFQLVGRARNPVILQRALDLGHRMLAQAIAIGREPEESRQEVFVPDDEEDV